MRTDSSEGRETFLRSREKGLWCSPKCLLTFDIFKTDFWPHLPQYLTKGICVFLVVITATFSTSLRYQAPTLAFSDFIGTNLRVLCLSPSF